jgi:MFS superfamily sulfate permease-like transporter
VETGIVTLSMLGIFFVSSYILPYVPTITASTLTLFIGMELLLKALWYSSKYLVWDEWITVVATTLACSVVGFAPGIGIGVALVVCFQFLRTAIQTVSREGTSFGSLGLKIIETPPDTCLHSGTGSKSTTFVTRTYFFL